MKRFRLLLLSISALSFGIAHAQQAQTLVCPRDDAAFAAVQEKAQANDPAAQATLASCYDLGMHVQPNGREVIRLLSEAANQGYVPAEYEVGRIYLYGRGVPADYAQALIWERKAAQQGDSRAQRDLAFMYERGFGVLPDPTQAAEWNRKAAAQGNAEAQMKLARALDEGAGVNKDSEEARRWYAKAAQQENPAAQLELARAAAAQGNCSAAAHWYEEAAGHGQTQAMYELGRLYLNKCGPDKDRALQWFTIGANFGSDESRAAADRLAKAIPAVRRKHDEAAASKWIKNHPGSEKEEDEEEKR